MKATDVLEKAAGHMRDRAATYDKPEGERSMARTVAAFNAITGRDLTTAEGWAFMLLLKQVRVFQNPAKPHQDSLEDGVAYAALLAEEMLSELPPEQMKLGLEESTTEAAVGKPADPREPLFTLEGRPVFKGDRVLGTYAKGDKFVHYCDELDVVDGRPVARQTYPRSDARTGTARLGTLCWPKETATAQVEKPCATCKHSHAPSGADPCVSCAVPGYGLTKWEPQS